MGTIISAEPFTKFRHPGALIGFQIISVVNLPPKQIRPIRSQLLVTEFISDDGSVVLARPDKLVANGSELTSGLKISTKYKITLMIFQTKLLSRFSTNSEPNSIATQCDIHTGNTYLA